MISPFQYLPYSMMFPLEQVIHEDRSYQKGRLIRKERQKGNVLGKENSSPIYRQRDIDQHRFFA